MYIYHKFEKNYNIRNLNTIFKNKNILVFDLETTGLPRGYKVLDKDNYEYCYDNTIFNDSRIIQIGWSYTEKWNNKFTIDNIRSEYRKSKDITQIDNSHIHNITMDILNKKGSYFATILNNKDFGKALMNADYIVAHNASFDVSILLNELNRIKYTKKINKLIDLIKNDRIICTLQYARKICENKCNLESFYKHYYNKEPENLHTADGDVKVLLLVLNKLINDDIIKIKYNTVNMRFIKYDEEGNDDIIYKENAKYFYLFCIGIKRNENNITTVKKYLYKLQKYGNIRNIYKSYTSRDTFFYCCTISSTMRIKKHLENLKETGIMLNFFRTTYEIFKLWEKILCDGFRQPKQQKKHNGKCFNHGKPWTNERSNELITISKAHELPTIEQTIGRTYGSIRGQLYKLIKLNKIKITDIKSLELRKRIVMMEKNKVNY